VTAPLVLNGVTIVDTRDGSLTPGMSIAIEGGKIARIAAPAGDGGVDARGTFAVPGYNDFHCHPLNAADPEGSLALMLANGITGFRQMNGTPELLEARRLGKLMPGADAPELLEMAGEILTGANASSVDAVVAEIAKQQSQGADFIKVIDVRPEVFFAGLAESTRRNLRYIGHLPPTVNVAEAATAGMRSIEHLGPKDAVLLGCSTEEAAFREAIAANPPAGPRISGPIPAGVMMRAIASPLMATPPSEFERYQRVIDTFSDAKCRALAAHFTACGTWHVPTLTRIRTMSLVDDDGYRNDPKLRFVPVSMRQMWEELALEFPQRIAPAARETLARLFAQLCKLVRPFKSAGVSMLAGSDSGGTAAWCIPGFGLHQEFDLLAEAGLTPLEILQMTTRNGAEFLGRTASMGSVEAGKDANLVLLSANPIASAANLHEIAGVVRGGTYYDAAALAALKTKTEHRVAAAGFASKAVGPPCC
jgi:hypothetical protein